MMAWRLAKLRNPPANTPAPVPRDYIERERYAYFASREYYRILDAAWQAHLRGARGRFSDGRVEL